MQMEYSFEKNVRISSGWMFASDSVSLPRLDNPTGACPTHRRQWADFLVSLMAPLHRQYKTARTETRRHLLLKIRQMPTRTSASRGYVFVRHKGGIYAICCLVPIRDTHKSPTNCLPGCGHDPRSAPNLEKHGSSKMQTFGWLEMPHFLNRISIWISSWNPTVWSSNNITYQPKSGLCLLRQFHRSILKLIPWGSEPRGRVPVQRLPEEASQSVPGSME